MTRSGHQHWLILGSTLADGVAMDVAVEKMSQAATRIDAGELLRTATEPPQEVPSWYWNRAVVVENDLTAESLRAVLKAKESSDGIRSHGVVPLDIDIVLSRCPQGELVFLDRGKLESEYARRCLLSLLSRHDDPLLRPLVHGGAA